MCLKLSLAAYPNGSFPVRRLSNQSQRAHNHGPTTHLTAGTAQDWGSTFMWCFRKEMGQNDIQISYGVCQGTPATRCLAHVAVNWDGSRVTTSLKWWGGSREIQRKSQRRMTVRCTCLWGCPTHLTGPVLCTTQTTSVAFCNCTSNKSRQGRTCGVRPFGQGLAPTTGGGTRGCPTTHWGNGLTLCQH